MDTPTAITILQAIAATLTDEVKGAQSKLDAVNVALAQLQGILNTPAADLVAAQTTIATLTQESADKDTTIATLTETNTDLSTQLETATTVAPVDATPAAPTETPVTTTDPTP